MKVCVVKYPGSHGVDDAVYAYGRVLGAQVVVAWHETENLGKPDLVIVPGGYSFGDYLRPGALAKASPISGSIRKFAADGGPVLGVGNGFQILCELGVLPGTLITNESASIVAGSLFIKVESVQCPFTKKFELGTIFNLPVAHTCGRYYADKRTLRELETKGHVIFRYCAQDGEIEKASNPNGSINAIAGVTSRHENVLGIMVHPERAVEAGFGGTAGVSILKAVLNIP